MDHSGIKIFSGTSNVPLAKSIVNQLGLELGDLKLDHFADGEISVKINETVRGYDVFFVQPTSPNVNDHLMEALVCCDAFKRASAHSINLVMPYYGYARQDRKTAGREPITAKLVADLLTTSGADRILTVDLHAGQIQGYFDIPVDHFLGAPLLAQYFRPLVDQDPASWCVVSPDLGGVTRARKFSHLLGLPIAILEKVRPKPNESTIQNIIGDVEGKNCIIIDDIIDTAGTITNAANYVKEKGAKEVYITATHAVLSGNACEKIANSAVKKCVVTDSIDLPEEKKLDKMVQVTIAPLMALAINRIFHNESISCLFENDGLLTDNLVK